MTHLLVTNDFPPKVGGIQSFLWELWRRLDPQRFAVLTPDQPGAAAFDAGQAFPVERAPERVLLPTRDLIRRVRSSADSIGADLVVIDPALPLGGIGARRPGLGRPYAVVVHGAEITVPGRIPGSSAVLRSVLSGAALVIASGTFPAAQAEAIARRRLPVEVIPPGVDCERFRPASDVERKTTRLRLGLPHEGRVVTTVSRLVPRKGVDVLIAACSLLARDRPDLVLVVAGEGRDRPRLERMAAGAGLPVHFLGAVAQDDLAPLLAASDVFSMLCRNRWRGLEQEGFGIVFLEAAACGVPQVAGDSGGAADAVSHGETGFVVQRPEDPAVAAAALALLLDDDGLRSEAATASRRRAEEMFSHDHLAPVLQGVLARAVGR